MNPAQMFRLVILPQAVTSSVPGLLASAGVVFSVLLLNMKLKIGNRTLEFLSTITLEFYLIHGLFLEFFSYQFCDIVPRFVRITNVALLIIVVFVPSVLSAAALEKCHGRLLKLLTCGHSKVVRSMRRRCWAAYLPRKTV